MIDSRTLVVLLVGIAIGAVVLPRTPLARFVP